LPNIINGDCLEILLTFKDKEFDYFLTSPPFKEEEFGGPQYWKLMDKVVFELERITSKAGFMFNSSTKLKTMLSRYPNIMRVLIWGKQPCSYSFRYEPIFVWQFGGFKVNKYIFKDFWSLPPVQKNSTTYENPIKLYKEILQIQPKGRVIDPFTGTGTTMKACKILGHDFTGIELDSKKPCFSVGIEAY